MSVRTTRPASPSRSPRPLPRGRDGCYLVPVEGAPLNTCPLREEMHRLRGLITIPLHERDGEPLRTDRTVTAKGDGVFWARGRS